MTHRAVPPQPPRLTGIIEADIVVQNQWMWQFYSTAVIESGLLDPSFQSNPGEFDPDNLPDPHDTSIARAQLTANEAYAAVVAEAKARDEAIEAEAGARTTADVSLQAGIDAASAAASTAQSAANAAQSTANTALTNANAALAKVPLRIVSGSLADPNSEFTIPLSPALPNANYVVLAQAYDFFGSPAQGAFVVKQIDHSTSSITVRCAAAPGGGSSVSYVLVLLPL